VQTLNKNGSWKRTHKVIFMHLESACTNLLIPSCKDYLEMKTDRHSLTKRHQAFIAKLTKAYNSALNPGRATTNHFSNIYFNIIISCVSRSSFQDFQSKFYMHFSFSQILLHVLTTSSSIT